MHYIISGGRVSRPFLQEKIKSEPIETLVVADGGFAVAYELNLMPDKIIGDFDSLPAMYQEKLKDYGDKVIRLSPMKDTTDTESALHYLLKNTTGDITILGGTGSRIDHVLGNISILGQGLKDNRNIYLCDENNRIRLADKNCILKKEELFGKYVSFFPFTTQVTHFSLKGFLYPLSDVCLCGYRSLTVSNELIEAQGEITLKDGVVIIIESRD